MKDRNYKKVNTSKPSKKQIRIMNSQTPLILIDANEISLPNPPREGSPEEKAETRLIIKALKNSSQADMEFADLADKSMISIFKSFAIENGLYFDDEYYLDLTKQLKTIILNLKFKFNRKRPESVNKKIDSKNYKSTKSPAYPSGHAAQAYVIANTLSREYPHLEQSILNIADRIALSRFQAGAHFPSDLRAGQYLANLLDDYVLGPESQKELYMEHNKFRRWYPQLKDGFT